jgi:hypothetical protein
MYKLLGRGRDAAVVIDDLLGQDNLRPLVQRVSKIVPQSNPEASEIEEGTIGGE